jgi:tyrosyl-tRNA synthetase
MNKDTTNIIDSLGKRGFIYQCTDLDNLKSLCNKNISAYIGFDCTAPSLHVGSLVQIMLLRHLQKHGHTPLIIIGKGTTKIGDPSGKDKSREMLDPDIIDRNFIAIKNVISKFLAWDVPNKPIIIDNSTWLEKINYLDFLRDFGRYFSVNKMISFESVKSRLEREQSLSFLEFNYMLLQAYDFYKLLQDYNCQLQVGGSDQWGNIVSGIDLIKRINNNTVYGLTTPLLTTSTGAKMGKTAAGAIWLCDNMLSSYDYWQFWRNVDDADVIKFLYLFTELPTEVIESYNKHTGEQLNEVKIILANAATKICHGESAAMQAQKTSSTTFDSLELSDNLPSFEINKQTLTKGLSLFQLMSNCDLAETNSAAKRLIESKAVKINDQLIEDKFHLLSIDVFNDNKMKLSVGKKKHKLIILVD